MGCVGMASGCQWRPHPTPQVSAQFPDSSPELCDSWMKQHGVHVNPICTPCLLAPRLCFSLPWAVVPFPPGTGCPCYWQISLSLVPGKSAFRLCLGMLLQSHLLQRIPPGCLAGTSRPPIRAGWVAVRLSPDHVEMPLFAMERSFSLGK